MPTHGLDLFRAAGLVRWGQRERESKWTTATQMLKEFDQIASNTFFSQGGFSWTSSTGAQARIEYVAIPRQWASSLVLAGTHEETVLGSGDFTDHKVVYAKVRMRALGAWTDPSRKPLVCDARAVVEAGCVIEQFREELAKALEIPKVGCT